MSEKIKGKARAPNFSREEQLLLCKVVEAFTPIIESKKTDSVKNLQKQEAWMKVAEIYNANTKNVPRSSENLIACYRNMKSKLKKQRSEAKMLLEDSSQKEALLSALEHNGKDWEAVSQTIEKPAHICKKSYEELQKELKKKETKYKGAIMGTGGGPPPPNDDAIDRLKKIIEPQMDGVYTVYDADSLLMKQFLTTNKSNSYIFFREKVGHLSPQGPIASELAGYIRFFVSHMFFVSLGTRLWYGNRSHL